MPGSLRPALTLGKPYGEISYGIVWTTEDVRGGTSVEAVIVTGGKQYRVTEGQVIRVERLPGEKGAQVEFREVRYLKGDGEPIVEPGRLGSARVLGEVVTAGKARKVLVVKFKLRKNYRRKRGHRQPFTSVRITKIEVA